MKFSIKQIAVQAGVSKATVDRCVHARGAVHPQTQRRIEQAIKDLELQQRSNLASGRTLILDVILHTPGRFSQLVTDALLAELGNFAPFRFSLRLHIFEEISIEEVKKLMLKCANDSYGIVLKATDSKEFSTVINELNNRHVPVVTLVTDQHQSCRYRYIGIENHAAGRTAAYMMSRWLKGEKTTIAAVIGEKHYRGEEERVEGFCETLRKISPHLKTVRVYGGRGIDDTTQKVMEKALGQDPDIGAIYSVGGANNAILRAFNHVSREIKMFIGHDLDGDNRILLKQGKLDIVIHHDLQQDARNIFRSILEYHAFIAPTRSDIPAAFSNVNVITPYNMM